jgi:uncharacterized membrane protein YobD (UPF0266 family)
MTFDEAVHKFIDLTTRFIAPMPIATEWVLAALAVLLIALAPIRSRRFIFSIRDRFRRLAGHKRAAIVICGVLPVLMRLAMLGFVPVPDPSIHDEFSHLLLGDTLAHGRLTNPAHPMWQHFETIHVIQRPTYNSMYPPGQGAFLAFGEVVFHQPWAGVVLAVGLMFAAICWMMQGWMPPAWAFYGTLIAILKFGVVGMWMNSYLGGAVPALGGALLIGSIPRIRREENPLRHGLLFGAALVILMFTRPFEGAVLGVAALMYIAPNLWKNRQFAVKAAVPAACVLACGVAFNSYYCWRVTGSPVRLPYQVNRDTYGWPENLAFLPAKKVVFRHKVLQAMYHLEVERRDHYINPLDIFESLDTRLYDNWTFFIGPMLTGPLLFLPWMFRNRRTRPLVIFLGVIAALNLFQLVLYPYHLGPIVPVLFTLVALGIRYIYILLARFDHRRAVLFALVLPACLLVVGAMKQDAVQLDIPLAYWEHAAEPHQEARADIEAWLEARPHKQLVIVRYSPYHSPNQEWVYNHADIDNSKVVWAREMDPQSDARLREYFSDREAWLLEADKWPQHVVRLTGETALVSQAASVK